MTKNQRKPRAGFNPAPSTRQILEQTRLSRLPRTSQSPGATCVNCKMSLGNQSEFSQKHFVCAACLAIYATIDAALNSAVEAKVRTAKIKQFAEKLEFGDK